MRWILMLVSFVSLVVGGFNLLAGSAAMAFSGLVAFAFLGALGETLDLLEDIRDALRRATPAPSLPIEVAEPPERAESGLTKRLATWFREVF